MLLGRSPGQPTAEDAMPLLRPAGLGVQESPYGVSYGRVKITRDYSFKNASDCSCVISKGLRQRMFVQESLSSRLTM